MFHAHVKGSRSERAERAHSLYTIYTVSVNIVLGSEEPLPL